MNIGQDLTAVRPAHRFDEPRLARYLVGRIDGFEPAMAVRQFEGGQSNPTFLLESAGRRYVLRKKPPGNLLPSAHAVDREYRVMAALRETGVPVPAMHLLCEDESVIGTGFYIMEFVDGRVFRDPLLPDMTAQERAAIYDAMNTTLADLHNVDWRAAGLADFGKTEQYVVRQIARWTRQYEATRTDDLPAMDRLISLLPERVPADESVSIAHGDFRLENLVFAPDGAKVLAILDWELATLGHPLCDLAFNCMTYYLPTDNPVGKGFVGTDVAALGIPAEDEYLEAYCRRTGREAVPDWPFFMAFSLFRTAAIMQGVYARALQGTASSEQAHLYGRTVATVAERGWALMRSAAG